MIRPAHLVLLLLLLAPLSARADYSPVPLFDLLGTSDLVLVGTIAELDAEAYTLAVSERIAGAWTEPTIRVQRFEDWECASRWAPYAEGQEVLVCLRRVRTDEGAAVYRIRSGGGEGEMPVVDGSVVCRTFAADAEECAVGDARLRGVLATVAEVAAAVRGLRACYAFEVDRDAWPRLVGVRAEASDEELRRFRERSPLAARLADAAAARAGR